MTKIAVLSGKGGTGKTTAVSCMAWYSEGAEVRCNKIPFNSLTTLTEPNRFLVDLGYADVLLSLRTLHARIRQYGVKVFFSFA